MMDASLDKAMTIIRERQMRAVLLRDRRVETLYAKHPELARLDREIRTNKAMLLLETFETQGAKADRAKLNKLEKEKTAYLRASKLVSDYDEPQPYCRRCQDTGLDNGAYCSCLLTLLYPDRLKSANLNCYPKMSFESFSDQYYSDKTKMIKVARMSHAYVETFSHKSKNLLFYGAPGTGKTFMAVSMAKAIVLQDFDVYFTTITKLLDIMDECRVISRSFSPDDQRRRQLFDQKQALLSADLLVIDELGVEPLGPNTIPDLLYILGQREQAGYPTIVTTNLSHKELDKTYDQRLCSRLLGNFALIPFEGEDMRPKVGGKRKEENS